MNQSKPWSFVAENTVGPRANHADYVYINGQWISRASAYEAARVWRDIDEKEAARLAEEAKKKDEEAKRQATIALRAAKHGMVRSHYDSGGYLLLDPARVREALERADAHGGMVTLHTWGGLNYDPVVATLGSTERRIPFTIEVPR